MTPDLASASRTAPDPIYQAMAAAVPRFSELEQRCAVATYRLLAAGSPVRLESVAREVDLPTPRVAAVFERRPLSSITLINAKREITGFGGLGTTPTAHRINFGEADLYTWCAWDSLFIPEILEGRAVILSDCPVTSRKLRIEVSPTQAHAGDASEVVVSFPPPPYDTYERSATDGMAGFCCFVQFFSTAEAGARWASAGAHRTMHFLRLSDAFELGRRYNALRLGAVLASGTDTPSPHTSEPSTT